MKGRVGRLDRRLQMDLELGHVREGQLADDVVVQLVDHALHNRFVDPVKLAFDLLLLFWVKPKSVPIARDHLHCDEGK